MKKRIFLNKVELFWVLFFLLPALAFILVNFHLHWLKGMIIPVSYSLNLEEAGWSLDKELSGFYSDSYTIGIAITLKDKKQLGFTNWDTLEKELKNKLGVTLKIEIRGEDNKSLLQHTSPLAEWTFTNRAYLKGSSATLYKFGFNAALFTKYRMRVEVVEGRKGAGLYHPQLFFVGIDDGYFWLRYYVNNILTGFGVIIFWVFAFIYKKKWLTRVSK